MTDLAYAHLRSASDDDLRRMKQQHQEAEDSLLRRSQSHGVLVVAIMAEQNRRICTHPPSSRWRSADDEGCRECLAERLSVVTDSNDPQGDPWASPSENPPSTP